MDDKPWLEYYCGESISELVQMGDQYRIDSLIIALHQALDQKGYRLGDDVLSDAETTVLSIEGLETEVNNGGYGQYFINSSNEYVGRIVMDLKRIGCDKIAEFTERAIAALGVEDLNSDSVGARAAGDDEALYEALDKCNDAYFALGVDIADKLFGFVKANIMDFKIPL